jgi:hypothetical protein
MGCGCTSIKKEFYTETDIDEEANIRKWEESIGAFKNTFDDNSRRISFESCEVSTKYAEAIFRETFGEDIIKVIDRKFFKRGRDYDAKKLAKLVFLISRPEKLTSSTGKYYDKVIYVFHDAKKNEEEDLNTPVEKHDADLIRFIQDLVEITFLGLTESYYEQRNGGERESIIKELFARIPAIPEFILGNLLSSDEGKTISNSLSFKEMNKKLDDNNWLLTPGHFREAAYEMIKQEAFKPKKREEKKE